MRRDMRSEREKSRMKKHRIITACAILAIFLLTAAAILAVKVGGPDDLVNILGKSEKEVVEIYGNASKESGRKRIYDQEFACVYSKKTEKVKKVELKNQSQKLYNLSIGDGRRDVEEEMEKQGAKLVEEKTISYYSYLTYRTKAHKIEIIIRNNLVSEVMVTAK